MSKKILFFLVVMTMLMSSAVVFGQKADDIRWVKEPTIIDSEGKKIDIKGALDVPESYKGNKKVSLEINGFKVNLDKNGYFTKSIFKASEIDIKVFSGKNEIVKLAKKIKYVMDKSRVNEAIKRIDELPTVMELALDDKEMVEAARKYYDALTPEEQELVTNLNRLEELENRIKQLLLLDMIQEAEDAIKSLPSFEDIRIKDKEAVLAAINKVDKVKEINPNADIVGEELLGALLEKIQYLEKEAADNYFFPSIYMHSPTSLETFADSNILFEGYVTNVKYLEKILIQGQEADVVYEENAEVKSNGQVVHKGPAYKFSKTLTLEDNSHAISVNVISQSGKNGSIARRFYVDTTPPELNIVVKERETTSDTAQLEINMKDRFSYLELYEFDSHIGLYEGNYSSEMDKTLEWSVDLEVGENVFTYVLIDGAGNKTVREITIVREEPAPIVTGKVQISLYKDSDTSSNKISFENIKGSFYLKNKATGKEYREGSTPWNRKESYILNAIPVGEYTIHFDVPEGMYTHEILLGDAYKETLYGENNLFVVADRGTTANYVKIVIKTDNTLKEIKPLEQLYVSKDITLEQFKAALPNKVTIVDSADKEHEVEVRWDIRPFVFESWKKPGEYTLYSEFFTLPINVSNTDPATRLEVTVKIIFE
ncbi:hypothetical protein SM124_16620 [Bacillus sp. 31A1R]|uniref:Uncharacterized protein n=1 Tax=Robertmurraya mangrovi TaxID=3098077 RepID=A0ABU5J1P8_9BACI|nr:hypothetical protein [Bacillus sp. 31A1R]MDZ5473344.1 hypothetical protein [Bacillus sp. 31A1R]